MNEKMLLNFESLCSVLDCDGPTALRLLRDGHIPAPVFLGAEPRWPVARLDTWADCGFPPLEPADSATLLAIRRSLIS